MAETLETEQGEAQPEGYAGSGPMGGHGARHGGQPAAGLEDDARRDAGHADRRPAPRARVCC